MDYISLVKELLYMIVEGKGEEFDEICFQNDIDLTVDENLDYIFRFQDGKIIVGDVGCTGQGLVVAAWERV